MSFITKSFLHKNELHSSHKILKLRGIDSTTKLLEVKGHVYLLQDIKKEIRHHIFNQKSAMIRVTSYPDILLRKLFLCGKSWFSTISLQMWKHTDTTKSDAKTVRKEIPRRNKSSALSCNINSNCNWRDFFPLFLFTCLVFTEGDSHGLILSSVYMWETKCLKLLIVISYLSIVNLSLQSTLIRFVFVKLKPYYGAKVLNMCIYYYLNWATQPARKCPKAWTWKKNLWLTITNPVSKNEHTGK